MKEVENTKARPDALDIFWRNTEYMQKLRNVSNDTLARTIKVSRATLQEHKAHPEKTTGAEIMRVAQHFEVPVEQMMVPFIPAAVAPKQI